MDGAHVQRVPQDKDDAFALAQVGEPVPGEHALDGHREILAIRRNQLEKRLRRRSDVFGHQHCAFSVENAHVHRTRVKIHAAIVAMLPGIESHRGLLSKVSVSPNTSLDGSDQLPSPPETGASISISALARTGRSPPPQYKTQWRLTAQRER